MAVPEEGSADEVVALRDEVREVLFEGEVGVELCAGSGAEDEVSGEDVGHEAAEGRQLRRGVDEEVGQPQDDTRLVRLT